YIDLPGDPAEPKLVPHEPGKRDADAAKEELAAGLERLADAYRFGGFRAARQDAEFRALNLRVKVVEADPHNLIANRALMTSYRRLGELVLEERNLSEARKRFEQALAVPAKLGEFADDPVFAPEKARIADRLLLCTLLEKGTANLDVVWAAPARVRGAALVALLEPGPGDQPEHVDRVVRMLWRHVQARDAEAAAALAGVGLDPRLADRTRGAEELYRLGRACAWLATRAPAGVDRQQYEGAALYYLAEARKRGFRDAGRVRADPVWASLKYSLYFPADLRPTDAAPPAK
ncbi:MAG: hypothetical protein K2P78_11460, partial [Gemmataceae bacterium]|nr:hypothetical protein [Gemmataceae bacterium]